MGKGSGIKAVMAEKSLGDASGKNERKLFILDLLVD
jgi:hypothetical protein